MYSSPTHAAARAHLTAMMWWYAANVFQPVLNLRTAGLLARPQLQGDLGSMPVPGLGPFFSRSGIAILSSLSSEGRDVDEFDRLGEAYDVIARPFSGPLFEETLAIIGPWLDPAARVLDVGCGAGREAERIARHVQLGEVVGVDLAAGMVEAALRNGRAHGLKNVAFAQRDAAALPADFTGRFDFVYSSLAHHHYADPEAVTAAAVSVLRPGGWYCVIDAGPAWFKESASVLAHSGDPGWIAFRTPDEFRDLFRRAGLVRFACAEILPGYCASVGQKDVAAPAQRGYDT